MEIATLRSSQLIASSTSRSASRTSHTSRSASRASQASRSASRTSHTSRSASHEVQASRTASPEALVNSLQSLLSSACVLAHSAASCLDVHGLAAELGFSKKAVAARTQPGTTFFVPGVSGPFGAKRLLVDAFRGASEELAPFVPCSWATVADTDTPAH